eukprot:sb/3461756/
MHEITVGHRFTGILGGKGKSGPGKSGSDCSTFARSAWACSRIPPRANASIDSAGLYHEPTETSKQPIKTRYLGHVTVYQPIRDQYFLIKVCIEKQIEIRKKPRCPICNQSINRRILRPSLGQFDNVLKKTYHITPLKVRIYYTSLPHGIFQFYKNTSYIPQFSHNTHSLRSAGTAHEVQEVESPTADELQTPVAARIAAKARVARTPARAWGKSEEKGEESRETSCSNEKENLMRALESGDLVSKKRKRKSPPIPETTVKTTKSSLFGGANLAASKERAMAKLLANARNVEASGVVPPSDLTRKLLTTPKPAGKLSRGKTPEFTTPKHIAPGKKLVSPFVLKPGSRETTPTSITGDQASLIILDKSPKRSDEMKRKEVEYNSLVSLTREDGEDDDSIGHVSHKRSRPLATPSEGEEDEEIGGQSRKKQSSCEGNKSPGVVRITNMNRKEIPTSDSLQIVEPPPTKPVTRVLETPVIRCGEAEEFSNQTDSQKTRHHQDTSQTVHTPQTVDTPKSGIRRNVANNNTPNTLNTPETPGIIKSTNTVLETPHGRIRDRHAIKETPLPGQRSTTPSLLPGKPECSTTPSRKQTTEESLPPRHGTQSLSDYAKSRHKAGSGGRMDNTKSTQKSTRPHNKASVVMETLPCKIVPTKRSPTLKIDKDGDKMNYTIEQEEGRLTIIQEGQQLMPPKLMKHIVEDVLHSDQESCSEFVNSLNETLAAGNKKADQESPLILPEPIAESEESQLPERIISGETPDTGADLFGDDQSLTIEQENTVKNLREEEEEKGETPRSVEEGETPMDKVPEKVYFESLIEKGMFGIPPVPTVPETVEKETLDIRSEIEVDSLETGTEKDSLETGLEKDSLETGLEKDSLEGFTYDQAEFNMKDYKKSFGLESQLPQQQTLDSLPQQTSTFGGDSLQPPCGANPLHPLSQVMITAVRTVR